MSRNLKPSTPTALQKKVFYYTQSKRIPLRAFSTSIFHSIKFFRKRAAKKNHYLSKIYILRPKIINITFSPFVLYILLLLPPHSSPVLSFLYFFINLPSTLFYFVRLLKIIGNLLSAKYIHQISFIIFSFSVKFFINKHVTVQRHKAHIENFNIKWLQIFGGTFMFARGVGRAIVTLDNFWLFSTPLK